MPNAQTTIDLSELRDLLKDINEKSRKALNLVNTAIVKSAYDIDRDLKETIQKGTRSGRTYKRRSVTHRASAPGEAPKTDTGILASSIRPVTSLMQAEVGSLANVAKYGGMLEEGTANMEPRPLFDPVGKKHEQLIARRISIAIIESGIAD